MAIRKPRPAKIDSRTRQSTERSGEADRLPSRGPRFRASVRRDGSIVIPAPVRKLMNLEAGGEVELEVAFAGLIVRPVHEGRDPEQWWFWTEAWQKGEREAEEDFRAGRTEFFASSEEFLAALEDHSTGK